MLAMTLKDAVNELFPDKCFQEIPILPKMTLNDACHVAHTRGRGGERSDLRRRRAEAGARRARLHAKHDGCAGRETALIMAMIGPICEMIARIFGAGQCIPRIAAIPKMRRGAHIDGDKRRRFPARGANLCLQHILDCIRRRCI